MDRSVRWSVDPVRWTGPRTGGQCFRVTPSRSVSLINGILYGLNLARVSLRIFVRVYMTAQNKPSLKVKVVNTVPRPPPTL